MLGLKEAVKPGHPVYRTQNVKGFSVLMQKYPPTHLSLNPPLRVCYLLGIVPSDRMQQMNLTDEVPAHWGRATAGKQL